MTGETEAEFEVQMTQMDAGILGNWKGSDDSRTF